jgi:chromosome segregation ATPase
MDNRRLRDQIQPLLRDREALLDEMDRSRERALRLREELEVAEDAELEADRLRDRIRDAAAAAGEEDNLREQLEDMNVVLHETYEHLNRANNEITRLQGIIDWLHHDDSDLARSDSCHTSSARSTPRSSSASYSNPSSGTRGETPDSSPSPGRRT